MNFKIAVHITYYQDSKLSLKRRSFLKKVILSYLSISKNVEIFIHTNKKFFYKHKSVKGIIHDLKGEHPFYLSWKCRNLIFKQRNIYDYFIYSEDDILFNLENFLYWKKYNYFCKKNNYNIGFVRVEDRKFKGLYAVDIFIKLKKFINLQGKNFIINDNNPYCALWIMSKNELHSFIRSNIWRFKWKTKYQSYGDIRAMSAMGRHAKNIDYYKATILPIKKINNRSKIEKGAVILHLDNKYSITRHGPGSLNYNCLLENNLIKFTRYHFFILQVKNFLKKFF
jgi:hypothetical protein